MMTAAISVNVPRLILKRRCAFPARHDVGVQPVAPNLAHCIMRAQQVAPLLFALTQKSAIFLTALFLWFARFASKAYAL
jgi:hypothetical protein